MPQWDAQSRKGYIRILCTPAWLNTRWCTFRCTFNIKPRVWNKMNLPNDWHIYEACCPWCNPCLFNYWHLILDLPWCKIPQSTHSLSIHYKIKIILLLRLILLNNKKKKQRTFYLGHWCHTSTSWYMEKLKFEKSSYFGAPLYFVFMVIGF